MKVHLADRLNDLPRRLLSPDVKEGKGLGNELGFFIFDYDPKSELEVRLHIPNVVSKLGMIEPTFPVASINILDQVYGVLSDQDLLARAMEIESESGIEAAIEAIKQAASSEDVAERMVRLNPPETTHLYLLHGVGAAYPLIRSHSLLSNLHSRLQGRSLVLFFPGRFDGKRLVLFNRIQDDNYYRAFRLYENPC